MWAQAVEAMRRAWRDSEPARSMPERGRPHQGAPDRQALAAGTPGGGGAVPAHNASRGMPDEAVAAGEAAHLLGFPEITGPHLAQFQRQYAQAASRDGQTLARQWLAHMRRSGLIDQAQHDAWRDAVAEARRSGEHAQWRHAHGLDPAPAANPVGGHHPAYGQAATRPAAHAARADTATAEHLAGHAGQLHEVADRQLGDAVDDPRTAHVDEQDVGRQEAYHARKYAEVYDAMASVSPDRGMAARVAAARPSPATIARAQAPSSLAGKRHAQVVAARPTPPLRPTPGRGMLR